MAERLEFSATQAWHFVPDASPVAGERLRTLVRARLVDDVSGDAVRLPTQLSTPRTDVTTRVAPDGLVGLVGVPARVLPGLAATPVALEMTATCAGYLPRTISVSLGPVPGFPAQFAGLDVGDVALHRHAVVISGRVMHNLQPQPLPLAGATVRLDAIWSTPPPPFWVPPALAEAPLVVSLAPGLYRPRAAAASVNQRAITLSVAAKTLLLPISPGQTRVRLSDRVGLVAGTVLALDFDHADRVEMIPIQQVEPTLASDEPSWVTLAHPVSALHRDGARATAATALALSAANTLARGGEPGDDTVFVAAAVAFANGATLEIDDGAAPPEYQRVALYATSADADGYFRLPPIARVALVRLLVQHAAVADAHPVIGIDPTLETTPLLLALE